LVVDSAQDRVEKLKTFENLRGRIVKSLVLQVAHCAVDRASEIIGGCSGIIDRSDDNANRHNRGGRSSMKQPQTVATGDLHRNQRMNPEMPVWPLGLLR
jgi:hypothetical protein